VAIYRFVPYMYQSDGLC